MLAATVLILTLAGLPPIAAAVDGSATFVTGVGLQGKLEALAHSARLGIFGITVVDVRSGSEWHVNANRGYPMMSVFKATLGATVLAHVDSGDISLEQTITLTNADMRYGASAIADDFHGDHMRFTVRQLLAAAVSHSDNTAADALVRLIGGPAVVTTFLRTHDIIGMRVDRDEGTIAREFEDLGSSGKPSLSETAEERDQRLQRGFNAYLADPRDRSAPKAAATFLRKLWRNELVSRASTQHLINLMYAQTIPHRLRGGLPADVRLADKCGTSYTLHGLTAAYNDIGILTWPDGRSVIVAAFLTASPASESERDALFVDLGHVVVEALHPQ